VTLAVDSSVAIAAVLADHEAHDQAEDALGRSDTTIAHVATETYSVLTRLPPPRQLASGAAAAIVEARLPRRMAVLDVNSYASALSRLAKANVSGGATYDGLIALTALEHELRLLSRDRRAARTYSALGVSFELLSS
jgi:predicted nucleic acid-binding protein